MSSECPIVSEKIILINKAELFVREFNFCGKIVEGACNKNIKNILWLHGWGRDGTCFSPTLDHFHGIRARHVVVDFPGFGKSPSPKSIWGVEDYARCVLGIPGFLDKKWVVVGHSFGCRVAFQMAYSCPNCIDRLCCIAAPCGAERRSLGLRLRKFLGTYGGKMFSALDHFAGTQWKARLAQKFGSRDYRNAQGILKQIMIKVVDEPLDFVARAITCPVILVYGSEDTETLPNNGNIYKRLINNSLFVELPTFDHHTILSLGHHRLSSILQDFMEK